VYALCHQPISYIIQSGDNLYQLSRYYRTTVPQILAMNPGIDPYNLQIGSVLALCPGDGFRLMPDNPNPPACPCAKKIMSLNNDMRMAWEQHVFWTRLLIVSITDRLNDQAATQARLLMNPGDIAGIFGEYYSADIAKTIESLLTEHLVIGADLITALRDGKKTQAADLSRRWYANADKMAAAFASINPYYDLETMRNMLRTHLDLTSEEVALRLAGNHKAEIDVFDELEREALAMADMFVSGIQKQFPHKF